MSLTAFIKQIKSTQTISFNDAQQIINTHYHYTPTEFSNGLGADRITNAAGSNEGSCKIFAFAKLHQLNPQQTLKLFGDFYQEVLNDPDGNGHQNIRNFMQYGWEGIQFSQEDTLRLK